LHYSLIDVKVMYIRLFIMFFFSEPHLHVFFEQIFGTKKLWLVSTRAADCQVILCK